jgi:hypothetical protein
MRNGKSGYRYRMTLDRNTLILERVCGPQQADSGEPPDAVVEELDGQQGLLHAIVSWLKPRRVYTDNCGHDVAQLVRACATLGVAVIAPQPCMPRAKSRAERVRGVRGPVAR